MKRVYNFSPGPAMLPTAVLERMQAELLDWQGSGMSVMEMSHRGKAFVEIAAQSEKNLRELLAVPANYKVLFLQGGATLQFAAVPLNLARAELGRRLRGHRQLVEKADRRGKALRRASTSSRTARRRSSRRFRARKHWKLSPDAAYLHYTPNETMVGVEFHDVPDGRRRAARRRHVVDVLVAADRCRAGSA